MSQQWSFKAAVESGKIRRLIFVQTREGRGKGNSNFSVQISENLAFQCLKPKHFQR